MTTDTETGGIRQRVTKYTDNRLASSLVIAGVVLFVIPEPITSFVGVLVLFVGLVAWLIEMVL